MSLENFVAASKAAEKSLDILIAAELCVEKGDQAGAKKCLGAMEAFRILHADALRQQKERLAAVAEGQVCQHSNSGETFYYSSVHDAVVSLWDGIYYSSTHPDFIVPSNFREWIGINTSQLSVGLLRERAKLLAQSDSQPAPVESKVDDDKKPSGMPRQEVIERLKRKQAAGEKFTSQGDLAGSIGCSKDTINKAIHSDSALEVWASAGKRNAIPKAQSLNAVVTDNKAQSRELSPEDYVRIREYLEGEDLTDKDRALFHSMTTEAEQIAYLDRLEEVLKDDPDQHNQIRGRRP